MGLSRKCLFPLFCAAAALCYLVSLLCSYGLFSPAAELYICRFEEEEQLTFAQAYPLLSGVTQEGDILLRREGERGIVRTGEAFKRTNETLAFCDLGELLQIESELSRLESAALFRLYGDAMFFDGGPFVFDGKRVKPSALIRAKTAVLLGGELPEDALIQTEARVLDIRARAELSASDLVGSRIKEVIAHPPYSYAEGAIYRETEGGKRLIAGMPLAKHVTVDCDFCDRGALLPAEGVCSLTLAFVGNSAEMISDFHGELAYLFATYFDYRVPSSLKEVKVTGGYLVSRAFYGCDLTSIDACGVEAEHIAPDAFSGLEHLTKLHTSAQNLLLDGQFETETAPCGCTIYRRYA